MLIYLFISLRSLSSILPLVNCCCFSCHFHNREDLFHKQWIVCENHITNSLNWYKLHNNLSSANVPLTIRVEKNWIILQQQFLLAFWNWMKVCVRKRRKRNLFIPLNSAGVANIEISGHTFLLRLSFKPQPN